MKRMRYTTEQIIQKLREADGLLAAGTHIPEICKQLGVSEATYHRWRKLYGGLEPKAAAAAGERECAAEEDRGQPGNGSEHLAGSRPGKILSPARRRAAVEHVQAVLGVSERRACRAMRQARSSQRYKTQQPEQDRSLVDRMVGLARANPRYGYRRIWALLRREGWRVNRKRVDRLRRAEGLKVPVVQRKRRRWGGSENSITRKRAQQPNQVWSYDFVMDQTEDGRSLKLLPIVDEFTRECLSIDVERHLPAHGVVARLQQLFETGGAPDFIRSDNGPEFIATVVKEWLRASGVKTLYIEPGSPWENAYSETFNSRFEDELLNRELFSNLIEAKVLVEEYRRSYNNDRPHSSLGYRTPAEFAWGWQLSTLAFEPPALRRHDLVVTSELS